MKLAFIYAPWLLTFRGGFDFETLWDDPRGLTGSEVGILSTAREASRAGHDVTIFTMSTQVQWGGIHVRPFEELTTCEQHFDASISWNDPATFPKYPGLKVFEQMLNGFSYCAPGFESIPDLWTSPSAEHKRMHLTTPSMQTARDGYQPDLSAIDWEVVPLGCAYPVASNGFLNSHVEGRVVYTSSPDRGLHLLLQEWPKIKAAVPHATLHIFYRLRPWIDDLKKAPYWPPIERLRTRALYIDEFLRRATPELDITVRDSVSRKDLRVELERAQVLAYPCDTIQWTEGFSCSLLEACAAMACPITMKTDALPDVYGSAVPMVERGDISGWSDLVIRALNDREFRNATNEKCFVLAKGMTWKQRTSKLLDLISNRLESRSPKPSTMLRAQSKI
jgi:hypothetical protein